MIVFYTNIVSPHQIPLAREIVGIVGVGAYRYIYSEGFHVERKKMGWKLELEPWMVSMEREPLLAHELLENSDILILGHRDLALIERRSQKGLKTYYASERWFKPFGVRVGLHKRIYLPGYLRMLVPNYRKIVRSFVSLANKFESFQLLPYGEWARRDFLTMGVQERKMTIWGYCVAASSAAKSTLSGMHAPHKVLWVGRMIYWKRVDTLIKAVQLCPEVSLTLVGDGPEKSRLQKMAVGLNISFMDNVSIEEVRHLMRSHDIYVLCSNGAEGWGAALNEAMEEDMYVLGSNEAGASATMLPASHRYSAGDYYALSKLICQVVEGNLPKIPIGEWSARRTAERFLELCR